jgi:hypothetical protein
MSRLLVAILLAAPLSVSGDEGMWTFNAFPKERVNAKYGFLPSDAWLENVRLSSVRLAGGCSGSFVSDRGLVMTNHHCAHECIEQLSTAQKDLVANGHLAASAAEELRCPDVEINQLVSITDVTARMRKASAGRTGEAFTLAQTAEIARIEKECQTSAELRCEVVTLFHGGGYDLYRYRRHQDVRLVFAPEFAIAFFGGDPDNFEFPRYDLDLAFLRVYEHGKPLETRNYFRWSPHGAEEGALTFVSGHPGGTDRQLTVAQLAYQRDVALVDRLVRSSELRGLLTGFQLLGPEQKRISNAVLFYVENGIKVYRGRLDALRDERFFAQKVAEEQALKDAVVAKDPALAKKVLPAWEAIARATARLRELRVPYTWVEDKAGFAGELFFHARTLLRGSAELPKPNERRLAEFSDAALPALLATLHSPAPIHPELERVRLTHGLTKLREHLGTDHPIVKKVLGPSSPEEVAARAVSGSKLGDAAVRKALWEGGAKAIAASDDPMIALARLVEPDARAIRKVYDDEVEAVVKKSHELIAEARFATQGRTTYPDATFTLRLSYGQVKGWSESGRTVSPFTTFAGAFERHTGRDPFALPASWLASKEKVEPATRFNLVTTNDIIGGNSGSPMIDAQARIVGLVFDGNIHSLGGNYGFDEARNRTVAVHSDAIVEALTRVYGAKRLVDELRPPAKGTH